MSWPELQPGNFRSSSSATRTGAIAIVRSTSAFRGGSVGIGPIGWLTIVVVFGLFLFGCGESISRQSLISGFQDSNPDATTEQAGCVVDDLMGRYSSDELEVELAGEPVSSDFEEAQFRAMFTCGVEGDVQEQIRSQLVANGVSVDDAPCVASELMVDPTDEDIDVLLSGEITDAFYAKFFEAMELCGAVG